MINHINKMVNTKIYRYIGQYNDKICAQELHAIMETPFHDGTTRRREGFHHYVLEVPPIDPPSKKII